MCHFDGLIRVNELISLLRSSYPDDCFFKKLKDSLEYEITRNATYEWYQAYEEAFKCVDDDSWDYLKEKTKKHFNQKDKKRGYHFFDQLSDVFAYQYLADSGCCDEVRILSETNEVQPDICYVKGDREYFCEVKTIHISNDETDRTEKEEVFDLSVYKNLSPGFFNKLQEVICKADRQIRTRGKGLIYLIIKPDDFTLRHVERYREQIFERLFYATENDIYIIFYNELLKNSQERKLYLKFKSRGEFFDCS